MNLPIWFKINTNYMYVNDISMWLRHIDIYIYIYYEFILDQVVIYYIYMVHSIKKKCV